VIELKVQHRSKFEVTNTNTKTLQCEGLVGFSDFELKMGGEFGVTKKGL